MRCIRHFNNNASTNLIIKLLEQTHHHQKSYLLLALLLVFMSQLTHANSPEACIKRSESYRSVGVNLSIPTPARNQQGK